MWIMYQKKCLILLMLSLAGTVNGQSLRIINTSTNADVSNDSIVIQSSPNGGFQGYESLDLGIKVINTASNAIEIGAMKIEEDSLQPDVQHTICFANNCYPATTFVSPSHVYLDPGASDSGFLAHYLFDNRVHIRGVNHVSYVFYNVNLPTDLISVHVTYNTIAPTAIQTVAAENELRPYPNPASDHTSFLNTRRVLNSTDARLLITDVQGNTTILSSSVSQPLSFNTAQLPAGTYYYQLFAGLGLYGNGRLLVVH